MEIKQSIFGQLGSGEDVSLFTLKNDNLMEVSITNYGATIVTLMVPDRSGQVDDIVLGFDSIEGYISDAYKKACPYFGCTIGRYANRIKKAAFVLNGRTCQVYPNEGVNSLHGGGEGFDKRIWTVVDNGFYSDNCVGVEMLLCSPDGDQGYPGNLKTTVRFSLQNDNQLVIEYSAVSDQDTVVNLTNHSYFNLEGEGNGDVLGNSLFIPSGLYLNLDSELIPDGRVLHAEETSLDFRESPVIREAMKKDGNDKNTGGYSHTYLLESAEPELALAARLTAPVSGRVMEVYTNEVGVLLYTGDGLDGSFVGKAGKKYDKWAGLCLETQGMPDAPNQPHFKSGCLKAGETYSSKTVYRFLSR